MAKIPEAYRQSFGGGIVRPSGGADFAAIAEAGAPFNMAANALDKLGAIKSREDTVKAAEYNSQVNLDFNRQFDAALKSPEVQQNPELAFEAIPNIAKSIQGSESFQSQPKAVQSAVRQSMASLQTQLGHKALEYQNTQLFQNTITGLNNIQGNYELMALETNADLDTILQDYTASVAAATKSGAMTLNEAEAQVKAGAGAITAYRAEQYISNKDLAGALKFVNDEDNQSLLGAKRVEALNQRIENKRASLVAQQEKLEKLKQTDFIKFLEITDSESLPPINFAENSTLGDALDNRAEFLDRKKQQYNVQTNIPVLTNTERTQMVNLFESTNPRTAAIQLYGMVSKLSEPQQSLLAQSFLSQKSTENHPEFAAAISLANEDPSTSQAILTGAQALKNKVVRMPSESEFITEITEELDGAIMQPQYQKLINESIRAVYASSVYGDEGQQKSSEISGSLVGESVKKIVGTPVSVNGKTTLSFRGENGEFLDKGDFRDAFEDIDENMLNEFGGLPRFENGDVVPLDEIKDEASLVVAGNGQYFLQFQLGEYLVNEDGSPYILDLKGIYDEQTKRAKTLKNTFEGITKKKTLTPDDLKAAP